MVFHTELSIQLKYFMILNVFRLDADVYKRQASICVQGGYEPKNGEPIEVPIYQSTTFKYDNSEAVSYTHLDVYKRQVYMLSRLKAPS